MRVCVGDLEGDGLLDTITIIWCGVFKDLYTKEVFKFRPHQIPEMLSFMDTVDVLIMHNGIGFDWPALEKLYGYEYKGKKVDTLVMSRLLDPKRLVPFMCPNKKAGPHSVEAWGYRVGRGKVEHNDWSQFSEEMLHRCAEDVEIQCLIFNELEKEFNSGDWKDALKLTQKLFTYLHKQAEYGWLVDKDHLVSCISLLDHWITRIDKALAKHLPLIVEIQETKEGGQYKYIKKPFLKSGDYSESVKTWYNAGVDPLAFVVSGPFTRISFRKVDLDSAIETKDFLLKSGWEPAVWNTNDAGERTSPKLDKDDPFEGITGGVGRLVAKRVQCKQRRSIIEGLIGIIRPDGRIASRVNSIAVTGRATHRGIVNIPKASSFFGKQMRKIFTSRDGYVLVGTDSDSCQLRMLAGRMNNPEYTDALCNGDKKLGTDNHSLTAKIGELESRDIAKNVMYCLLFGGGDAKLAKTAKKPVGSGPDLRDRLYRGLDGLGDLMDRLTKEWRSSAKKKYNGKFNRMEHYNGYITGLDGRPILVPSEHQVLVYLLQSDEAIMMSAAYCRFHMMMERDRYIYGEDYGTVCWYHDEFTVECKEGIADVVAEYSEQSIAWAGKFFNISCPHIGDAKIGKNWYSIH